VLLLSSACNGDPQNPGNGADPTGDGILVTGTASPGPGEAATSAAPPAEVLPTTAEQYTKKAIDAWKAHNVSALDQYEVGDGILHTMWDCGDCYNAEFTLAPGNCQGAAGSSYCRYFNKYGDDLLLRVTNELLGHPRAIVAGSTFEPTAFPSDNQAYAQLALNAWLAGNDNRLKLLTKDNLTSAAIDAKGAERGTGWTFDHAEGAMGSVYMSFKRGAHSLVFQFVNGPPAPTTGPDSQHRIVQVIYTA